MTQPSASLHAAFTLARSASEMCAYLSSCVFAHLEYSAHSFRSSSTAAGRAVLSNLRSVTGAESFWSSPSFSTYFDLVVVAVAVVQPLLGAVERVLERALVRVRDERPQLADDLVAHRVDEALELVALLARLDDDAVGLLQLRLELDAVVHRLLRDGRRAHVDAERNLPELLLRRRRALDRRGALRAVVAARGRALGRGRLVARLGVRRRVHLVAVGRRRRRA